jgi:hypothetical protein
MLNVHSGNMPLILGYHILCYTAYYISYISFFYVWGIVQFMVNYYNSGVCMYVFMYIYVRMYVCMYVSMYVRMYVCV